MYLDFVMAHTPPNSSAEQPGFSLAYSHLVHVVTQARLMEPTPVRIAESGLLLKTANTE